MVVSSTSEPIPAGVISVSDDLSAAPLWRREPFRLFFPLGVALSWAGVLHWLAHALGILEEYRSVFHAMTQIQGFMSCFVVGFLFTMLPRRTGSAPPSAAAMVVCLVAPLVTTVAAWNGRWALAQVAWLMLAFTVVGFAVRRFVSATSRRSPPNSFVWIPAALLMGISGSVMAGAYGVLGVEYAWLHQIGRGLVLQGMLTGMVLGVGGLAIPLMTRAQAPRDGAATLRDYAERAAHLGAAAVLAASFVVEVEASLRLALMLRATVSLLVLLLGAGIWQPPTQPGWNRRLIWVAAWMLPIGYGLAAAFPWHHKSGLHVVFLGGFALLALAVSTQVVLGHGGHRRLMMGRPWQVPAIGGLVIAAMVPRALVDFDPAHFSLWLGTAALLFLSATLVWASLVVPKLVRGDVAEEDDK